MIEVLTQKDEVDYDLLVNVFKALSNETRLEIFDNIRKGCCCSSVAEGRVAVRKFTNDIKMSPSTISHHIKELRRARLIDCKKNGQNLI